MTDTASQYAGPERVLSGVQPSGALHLGNYLGALVKFARLQHEIDTFIFVADMHAITVWQEPGQLAAQTREIAAAYLASGLDPAKATIFPQSMVREHAELAWIFNCVARLGWLDRMTQFKEKSGKHKERASVGLYTYPVLQPGELHQGAEIVAQVQGAGRLDAGEHALGSGVGGGGLVGHVDVFDEKVRSVGARKPPARGSLERRQALRHRRLSSIRTMLGLIGQGADAGKGGGGGVRPSTRDLPIAAQHNLEGSHRSPSS